MEMTPAKTEAHQTIVVLFFEVPEFRGSRFLRKTDSSEQNKTLLPNEKSHGLGRQLEESGKKNVLT